MPFYLRVLGLPDLVQPDGKQILSVIAQPKRFALLTYIAAHRDQGCSRDELIGVFWANREAADARNALRQALHYLRRSLGDGVFVDREDRRLQVDAQLLESDLASFQTRLASGDLVGALELYGGELAEGLYVDDCVEFDQWRDRCSATLCANAVQAAETLSEQRENDGDLPSAIESARTALDLAPHDESIARSLMRLLARSGDREGALRAFRAFEHRLMQEVEMDPSPETVSLFQEISAVPVPVEALNPARPGRAPSSAVVTAGPAPKPSALTWLFGSAAVLLLVVVAVLANNLRGSHGATELPRLIVLPFENLGSPEDDYFTDGITEEITSSLAGISGLRVIARQTAIQYGGSPLSALEIAEELDVDYVLEGTVRTDRAPDGTGLVRITPQLIRASDQTHIWADPYTTEIVEGDLFRIQAELASRIAEGMNVVLPSTERDMIATGGTRNAEAHDFYLRGVDYMERDLRRLEHYRLAAEMFEQAVASDPDYLGAQGMLLRAYSAMASGNSFSQAEAEPKARAAAERIRQMGVTNPLAQMALGDYHRLVTRRFDVAERYLKAARSARPNDASLPLLLADVQARLGNDQEATATLEAGLQLDPRSGLSRLARFRMENGRLEEAKALLDRAILFTPDSPRPYFWKTVLCLLMDESGKLAREVVAAASGRADLINFMLVSWDFDDELVFRLMADEFDPAIRRRTLDDPADPVAYYFIKGDEASRSGRKAESLAYYDSARVVLEGRLGNSPDPERTRRNLGLAYAHLGRHADARHIASELPRGTATAPEIYLLIGDYDAAVALLESESQTPLFVSRRMLRIDPLWAPLADHPGFQELLSDEED
jgi:TolB-like protein/DNA-binding SARP family transcriptional activator